MRTPLGQKHSVPKNKTQTSNQWLSHFDTMAQFEEVLDRVRLALTCASPAEIQALLEGLVKERIISDPYSKNLILHQRTMDFAPVPSETDHKPASDPRNYPGPTNQQHVNQGEPNQVCQDGAISCQNQPRLDYASPMREYSCVRTRRKIYPSVTDEHNLNPRQFSTQIIHDCHYRLGLNDKMTELLRNEKAESECNRRNEGNLEKEWLEQVEEAARRIAVPLWQHWDRGWRTLLPLVPTGCSTSENIATGSEAQCPVLIMDEEMELTVACRTLDLYDKNLNFTETTDQGFTLDSSHCQVSGDPKGLDFSVATNALDLDHFSLSGAAWNTDNITDMWESDPNNCWVAQGTSSRTEDLLCATLGVPDSAVNAGSADGLLDEQRVDSQWGAKMQKVDHDPYICPSSGDLAGVKTQEVDHDDLCSCPEFGDLPDNLDEYLNEDYLSKIDPDVLFGDPLLSCVDELNNYCDALLPFELPSPDSHPQRPEEKLSDKRKNRSKRPRVPQTRKQSTDENTPSRPKRQRVAGQRKRKLAEAEPTVKGTDTESEPSPADTADLSSTPPRILHLHPSIQFITIPDTPGYQVVQTLRLSPPVIRLPIPNTAATPTYILVPAASPPCKRQVLPLSPLDGAVVPVQMSSSPPGSLSDTASKAMSPTCASPLSPSDALPTCKDSPLPQSATVPDIPTVVKDYIQEAKTHMSQISQDMGEGLRLTSHYVDVQLSQREIFSRCGKNTNKFLDKELIIMGDTDRQKSLMGQSQIFEGQNGDKPKRYILLLGNAGMGKTTLIKKLCLDWSRDCIPQFDFVFFLDGKALGLTESTFSLQTLLLHLSSFAPTCLDPDTVYAQIIAAPKRVLIIFDGFELRDYESLLQAQEKDLITSLQRDSKSQTYTIRQLYSTILQRVLLPGCTLLLSARPRGTVNQLLRRADSYLEVCGFSSTDIETYVSQYFADPDLTASALNYLKSCSYLHLLCWNPGLCRLVCLVLEQTKSSNDLPRTLTGLCHQVLHLKMKNTISDTPCQTERQTEISVQCVEPQTENSSASHVKRFHKNAQTKLRSQVRTQRSRRTKKQQTEEDEVKREETGSVNGEVDRIEERVLLSQLSSMAWDGVKANSSVLPTGPTVSAKLKAFGLRTGLFFSCDLRTRHAVSSRDMMGKGGGDGEEKEKGENESILLWASPFLQSYLAAVHMSLSRTVSDRTFLQTLPSLSGQRGRRRPQREELKLTQRFAFGLLFHNRTELQRLHLCTEAAFRDMLASKQDLITKHLEGFLHSDLSPAQVLEACHYVYEASLTHGDNSRDGDRRQLIAELAAKLPEVLTFQGVPLNPADVFAVQNVLTSGGSEGQDFCLDLVDSGIKISGLRTLVGLSNINTYRACIADVITLWEQLEKSGEERLRQKAVSKFKINPLKATQVCHIEHLAKLVNVHMQKRLSDSSRQPDSILDRGVPAVEELHKLEFELGPENGPRALPKLWELLPGLHCLQHLDLENSKIGDSGAEKLADALVSLCVLEVLNLSQNCIGDQGMRQLATTLRDLPKLHCLSLYSNVISDEGAKSLAAVLPHMTSLTDLDVKYNKLTDVGAQSLGVSLRDCKKMKTLRMWNQCIPYGVFERLQQQDNRILWH